MRKPSRREARASRKAGAALQKVQKTVRLGAADPRPGVRLGADPGSIFALQVEFQADSPDRIGLWSRSGAKRDWTPAQWQPAARLMRSLSGLTWGEIARHTTDTGHKKHHGMAIEIIDPEAQQRLVDINRVDADTLFRFRLGNRPRLWGFRFGARFDLVWFDREHDVYPTDPS